MNAIIQLPAFITAEALAAGGFILATFGLVVRFYFQLEKKLNERLAEDNARWEKQRAQDRHEQNERLAEDNARWEKQRTEDRHEQNERLAQDKREQNERFVENKREQYELFAMLKGELVAMEERIAQHIDNRFAHAEKQRAQDNTRWQQQRAEDR